MEELAQEADVSVDTIRFYQKRRLLPPPRREGRLGFYGPEHLDRLARIRDLRRRGLTLALIGRLVRGELDATDEPLAAAVLAADAEDAEEFLSLEELARRCNIPLALLEAVANEGLLVRAITKARLASPRATSPSSRRACGSSRRGSRSTSCSCSPARTTRRRATAQQAVAMFDEHVRRPLRDAPMTDDEKAARLVAAFAVLLPSVTTLVAHHFRRVLLEVAQEHLEAVGHESEIAAASVAASRRLEGQWRG